MEQPGSVGKTINSATSSTPGATRMGVNRTTLIIRYYLFLACSYSVQCLFQ